MNKYISNKIQRIGQIMYGINYVPYPLDYMYNEYHRCQGAIEVAGFSYMQLLDIYDYYVYRGILDMVFDEILEYSSTQKDEE